MKQFQLENRIGRSAIKAEIDPKTAGKYIKGAAGPEEQPGEPVLGVATADGQLWNAFHNCSIAPPRAGYWHSSQPSGKHQTRL
jgi:hypothetical protein